MIASSVLLAVAISVAVAVDVVCLTISFLKGRLVFVLFIGILLSFGMVGLYGIGLFGPLLPVFSACRLGRPNSIWARRYYGAEKLALAEERFT